jgi:hypothetical protein
MNLFKTILRLRCFEWRATLISAVIVGFVCANASANDVQQDFNIDAQVSEQDNQTIDSLSAENQEVLQKIQTHVEEITQNPELEYLGEWFVDVDYVKRIFDKLNLPKEQRTEILKQLADEDAKLSHEIEQKQQKIKPYQDIYNKKNEVFELTTISMLSVSILLLGYFNFIPFSDIQAQGTGLMAFAFGIKTLCSYFELKELEALIS